MRIRFGVTGNDENALQREKKRYLTGRSGFRSQPYTAVHLFIFIFY